MKTTTAGEKKQCHKRLARRIRNFMVDLHKGRGRRWLVQLVGCSRYSGDEQIIINVIETAKVPLQKAPTNEA